ncbi:hypothetical protein Bca52824_089982 [Brassica carinata]|uniref:TOD1/MUCI70 glycosyltransferase-like domain-containing protein n=1 Tax=Brassica carinata TaxID=52824 RepID=A0A8X7NU55_BRACI|nr:hypothetical protein Bca52824_089982 [Brassica carinata]
MINKLSGGITYEEREGLADPMRKEVALLLPPEELENLDILESKESSSPVKKLVSETVSVHCGFFNENGGFRISDEDKKFMRSCQIVVSTCAFGGGDHLYQPIGMSKAST